MVFSSMNFNDKSNTMSQFKSDFMRNQSVSKMGRTSSMGSDHIKTDQTINHQDTSRIIDMTPSKILEADARNDNLSTFYCAAPIFSLDD